ncbi:MAG: triose-phosphate isomerase [Bacteroidia bacterium]|nr:triose-phosphate isomerase [Methylotenera sp.]
MRRKLVVANWKMHGNLVLNEQLFAAYIQKLSLLSHVDIAVCVPYPYLAQAQALLKNTNIAWGAQNLSKDAIGAFTGEVSAMMLKDFGASYVIIGHSERATAYCESDENIAVKFKQAKSYGLTPILCVGETLIEREAGVMQMVVGKQLDAVINAYGASIFADAVVSYEPIWAIGTGLAASGEQAQTMHEFIRSRIAALDKSAAASLKILYGGSVNPQNAVQLFAMQDIDGGLIGKCSLNAQEFEKICRAVA